MEQISQGAQQMYYEFYKDPNNNEKKAKWMAENVNLLQR